MSARCIAASASGAKVGGPATGPFTSGTRCGNGIYSQSPNHPGGDSHRRTSRRRSPQRLATIVQALSRPIEHEKIIRVHSRVPVVAPARVDVHRLVRALKTKAKATYVVLHANHARELSPNSRQACARLVDGGIPMLESDGVVARRRWRAQNLGDLMRVLVECRVKPYYLATAIWRRVPRIGARALRRARLWRGRYAAGFPGFASRPMSSTFRRARQIADRTQLSQARRQAQRVVRVRRRRLQWGSPRLSAKAKAACTLTCEENYGLEGRAAQCSQVLCRRKL